MPTPPPTRTADELALQAWAQAVVGDGYEVVFAPRSGPEPQDSFVTVQVLRRERMGTPFKAVLDEAFEGGAGCLGAVVHHLRVRADLNCYGPDAGVLTEKFDDARARPELVEDKDTRLRTEKLSPWADLSSLEGPGWRARWRAELTFQWQRKTTHEVASVADNFALSEGLELGG